MSLNNSNEAVFDMKVDDIGLWKIGLGLPVVLHFYSKL